MKVRSQADPAAQLPLPIARDLCASEDVVCGVQVQGGWLGLVVEKVRVWIDPGLAAKAAGVACA